MFEQQFATVLFCSRLMAQSENVVVDSHQNYSSSSVHPTLSLPLPQARNAELVSTLNPAQINANCVLLQVTP